jgi:regulatory protein
MSNEKVMTAALRLLTRREYSRQELSHRLSQQFDANEVVAVVDECIRLNLLSEDRFVESRVRHRIGQGYGPERIKYDLRQHGIEDDSVHAHLEEDELFWIQQAEQLILKKYGNKDIDTQKLKIQRYLYQRGYSMRVIHQALKNID